VTDEWSTYISQVESVAPPSIGVKPERGDQLELGAKFAPRELNALFSAAIYDLTKKDVTMTVMEGGTPTPRTMGETRVRGFDFEAKVDVTDDFNITGGYSFMKTEVVEGTTWNGSTYTALNGNEFIAAPNHSASLWGQYTLPGQNAEVGLGARYIGSYYFNALNTSKSEAATLIDAAFTYRLSKASDISVNVHNLTDKQYVVGSGTADYYNPGRTINASVSYNW
jgi:iron complex outermembrane receptor protein